MLVEVGRSMSRFLKYIGLAGVEVDVVARLYSESYMDWMLHCGNMSWSNFVLAASLRRVERM